MKVQNIIWKIKHILYEVSEVLYLIMFSVILGYRFLNTTQFLVEWNIFSTENKMILELLSFFLMEPFVLLGVIIVLRYLCSETYDIRQYLIAAVFVGITVLIFQNHDTMPYVLMYVLLIVGAKDISFRKLLKIYLGISIVIFMVTILAAQFGIIKNLVWNVEGRNTRISFGFIYPTDFAAHIFYMVLCYWYIRRKRFTYIESSIAAILGIFVYLFCEARFSTAMLLLLSLAMLYCRFRYIKGKKEGIKYQMHPVLYTLLMYMPLICAVFIHLVSIFYDSSIKFFEKFNNLISSRLALARQAINIFGFQLWGSDIPMVGNGSRSNSPEKYFYIDSTYLQISLIYGVVFLTVILIIFLLVGEQAHRREDWIFLWVIALAALHGIFEQHLIELEYFPFLFAAFADMSRSKEKKHGKKK